MKSEHLFKVRRKSFKCSPKTPTDSLIHPNGTGRNPESTQFFTAIITDFFCVKYKFMSNKNLVLLICYIRVRTTRTQSTNQLLPGLQVNCQTDRRIAVPVVCLRCTQPDIIHRTVALDLLSQPIL